MTVPTILLLGDSLVDFGDWTRLLPPYRTISSGVPGERALELLQRLTMCLPDTAPDAIAVMTGTNDLFFGMHDYPGTMHLVVTEITSRYPGAPVLLTSLLPMQLPGLDGLVERANEDLRIIAERSGCCYFDLHRDFRSSDGNLFDFDGVHLSDQGYQLWADKLMSRLARLLSGNQES